MAPANRDTYQIITDKIIAALEEGTRPWFQPWGANGTATRPLRHNGVPYRGINTVLLWMAAAENGFASPYWMTYRQAQQLGGQVRKTSRSSLVVYAGAIEKAEQDDAGTEIEKRIPFMKGYSVFSADQIDNLPDHFYASSPVTEGEHERIAAADEFFANLGADIREGGDKAFYHGGNDFIQMPPFAAFVSAEAHASTLAHECIHWTKHNTRLDRNLGRKTWGDEGYAMEELVAELGSVFLAVDLGIEAEPREDHASYISGWLSVLKNDRRAVFQAASHAEKAVAFLHDRQPQRIDDDSEHAA